ncbi:MAG: hypothetical protein Q8P68_01170 [Candidatus Peregrinibacteria bacterium]|nr:hypothetical protein [Candidatus Peregrinibacteria bacterium]MDZ4244319.1 hypothetical protein [Candidatus Gracilibacteria bacterium]
MFQQFLTYFIPTAFAQAAFARTTAKECQAGYANIPNIFSIKVI